MAADALEEKILKIRQQNEEIRRRHEEVEADKKNAAQLNALVQLSPSTDWPERKEPPEFSFQPVPTKTNLKPRNPPREHNDHNNQYRPGPGGGGIGSKKIPTYSQGEGPPPDPKYNFLADSEREEQQYHPDNPKNDPKNRGKNGKINSRNSFHKKLNDKKDGNNYGRDYYEHNDNNSLDESHPDYDAWRIERKKIDEARINRQITAEGNWRREWDNDKIYMADDGSKKENSRFNYGDNGRHDYADGDRYHPRGQQYRNSHYSNVNTHREFDYDKKVVFSADDKNNKGLNNHADKTSRSSVMSVRVSASNIAGTGRVGPRQRTRMMYSSQSGGEPSSSNFEISTFNRQPSFDEKPNSSQNTIGSKSPHPQRKRDTEKSFFSSKRDDKNDDKYSKSPRSKDFKNFQKSSHPQRQGSSSIYSMKSPKNNNKKTLEMSRLNSSKFSDKKVEFKIDHENKRRSLNFEGERSTERRVEKSKKPSSTMSIGDWKEEKKFVEDERDVFEAVDEFNEISNNFEISNFEDSVHDDSGYVETTCDDVVNVESSRVLGGDELDVDGFEENNESPEDKYEIESDQRFENQFENLIIDHFVDEKIEEDNGSLGTPGSNDVGEKNVEDVEEKATEILKEENPVEDKKEIEILKEEKSVDEDKKEIEIENEDVEIKNEESKEILIIEKNTEEVLTKKEMVVEEVQIVEEERRDEAITKESQDVELEKLESTESLIIEKNQVDGDKSEEHLTADTKVEEIPVEKVKEEQEELSSKETVEEGEDVDEKLPPNVDEKLKEEQLNREKIAEENKDSKIEIVDNQSSENINEKLPEKMNNELPKNTDEKLSENIINEKLNEESLNQETVEEIEDSEIKIVEEPQNPSQNVGVKLQDVENVDVPIVTEKSPSTTSDIVDGNNQTNNEEANIFVEKISELTTAKSGSD